jgi:16S rRNA (guanine527-N7)-methyltransferase
VFHVKHEAWTAEATRLGVDLSGRQVEQLAVYEMLLQKRGVPAGAIAASDAARIRSRHILDALRAAPLVPGSAGSLCDLGSGAGLPGVVLAVALPHVAVMLTEQRRIRVAILEFAIDELGLDNAQVHAGLLQDVAGQFDVCTARAFAPARGSWAVASRILTASGVLLYWAGTGFDPASELPQDVVARSSSSGLARSGPVVIMSRQ